MKKTFVDEIIKNDTKLGLIIDESTSLSNKSSLIVYVRCSLPKTGMSGSTNIFVDLIELDGVAATAVFDSLMNCLRSNGISDVFLSNNLTSLTCDGAATMIGKHKGVATLFREKFPSVIVWHCANHRLELSVSDVIKSVLGVNRFKSFIDKLCCLSCFTKEQQGTSKLCNSFGYRNFKNWKSLEHPLGGI